MYIYTYIEYLYFLFYINVSFPANLRGYELMLPEDFEPTAGDGEVESFQLMGPGLGNFFTD